jgi:hypothetical protein
MIEGELQHECSLGSSRQTITSPISTLLARILTLIDRPSLCTSLQLYPVRQSDYH